MKKFILTDGNGNIIGSIESNNNNIVVDTKSYADISNYQDSDDILSNSKDYKVTKDLHGKFLVYKIKPPKVDKNL